MAHSEWDLDRFFKILGLGFIFSKREIGTGIGIHFFLTWDWDSCRPLVLIKMKYFEKIIDKARDDCLKQIFIKISILNKFLMYFL